MKDKLFIISSRGTFDYKSNKFTIGGIQTYIRMLASFAAKNGYETILFVNSQEPYNITFGNFKVIGLNVKSSIFNTAEQKVYDKILKDFGGNNAKIVIASDQFRVKSRTSHTLAIQHGIAFDMNVSTELSRIIRRSMIVGKQILRTVRNLISANDVEKMVMVDYNYFNWHLVMGDTNAGRQYIAIPNFSTSKISFGELKEKLDQKSEKIKIVFARRFVEHRGTLIFLNAAKKILDEFDNVEITFAGDGPLRGEIERFVSSSQRSSITSYNVDDSVEFHRNYDIAVVPTLSSEGTSLSILEAMSAGCFPIVSYVGGLTNIIIDGYNGLLINPSEDAVYMAMKKAILMNKREFSEIVKRSYDTATLGFSKEKWENKWLEALANL